MNTPCLPFCGWELDFWEISASGDCASGMPTLSHIPKIGYNFLMLSNLKNKSLF